MVYVITLVFLSITLLLIWFLRANDKGPKESIGALWLAFGFGVLSIILAMVLNGIFAPDTDSWFSDDFLELVVPLSQVFTISIIIGFIEEIVKFVPLAIFIFRKNYFNEHNDGIMYFAVCGLTFGLFENIAYTLSYGAGTGIGRLILLPIFHGASTAVVGYFLAKKKIRGESWIYTILALITVSIMHGVYNFGAFALIPEFQVISLMLTLLLAIGLFIFLMQANEYDRSHGISAQGPNKYCKRCGSKNVNKSLHCESCGARF